MRGKYILLVFVLIVGVVLASLYYLNKTPDSQINLQYIDECIDGRSCLKIANDFYVGNNEKELQNGYYDFKVSNTQNEVTIIINKLWYKEFNETLYEQEYVELVCKYISKIISGKANAQFNKNELEYLYKNILEIYPKAKENVQCKEEKIINNIKFTLYTENYELVLNMEVI